MNRTFPHFQSGLAFWARRWYEQTRAGWGKLMDPGEAEPLPKCPWVRWIVRFYLDDHLVREDVMRGAAGAAAHWQRIEPLVRARPWLREPRFYLEHHNEPSGAVDLKQNAEHRKATADYGAEMTRILYNEGIRSVAGCLGVGHPEPYHAVEVCAAPMAAVLKYGGLYSFHEYGWPVMDSGDGWWTLRYRRTLKALIDAGATKLPPIAITESGIDGRLVQRNEGWQKVNNDPRWYATQLAWYDSVLDPYVVGQFVFTATPCEPWQSEGYEFTEALADEIAKRWTEEAKRMDVRIFDADGKRQDNAWLRATYGEVQVTASADSPYYLAVLREDASGSNTLRVRCRVTDGPGLAGRSVVFGWPDGQSTGVTDDKGYADFAMSKDAYYPVPGTGPHYVETGGVRVSGLGMKMGTNHWHFNVVLHEPESPQPPPDEPDVEKAKQRIKEAQALLDEALALLA